MTKPVTFSRSSKNDLPAVSVRSTRPPSFVSPRGDWNPARVAIGVSRLSVFW
ncbi:hypothetical protein QLH51_11210 [Sphingomonas sp. 2R-10]|uniref:hypothetical protein n=1 Tax=Sphingomonas sp. 2R-10 TaxID=3045148 RepID=UPI0019D183DD|nr:hypothetical protein [Sphingomonas sp. 2R-10]MDJ0277363.1 hypothetical protein [Sphingomonas sp. 2R-10]